MNNRKRLPFISLLILVCFILSISIGFSIWLITDKILFNPTIDVDNVIIEYLDGNVTTYNKNVQLPSNNELGLDINSEELTYSYHLIPSDYIGTFDEYVNENDTISYTEVDISDTIKYGPINAGRYLIKIIYSYEDTNIEDGDDSFSTEIENIEFTILKAKIDISNLKFDDYSVTYNKEIYNLEVIGQRPTEIIGISYSTDNNKYNTVNNVGASDAGEYNITATFIYDNSNYYTYYNKLIDDENGESSYEEIKTDSLTAKLTINRQSIETYTLLFEDNPNKIFYYTGNPINELYNTLKVFDSDGNMLIKDQDFIIYFSDDTNKVLEDSYHTVKITGINNYKDYFDDTYIIKEKSYKLIITPNYPAGQGWQEVIYNGQVQRPSVTVTDEDGIQITDANLSYDIDSKNQGRYTIKVSAEKDGYETCSEDVIMLITPITLSFSWKNNSFNYDKNEHNPTIDVSGILAIDDCEVVLTDPKINAGNYTAVASLINNDNGNYILPKNVSYNFTINPLKIDVTQSIILNYDSTALDWNSIKSRAANELTFSGILANDTISPTIIGMHNGIYAYGEISETSNLIYPSTSTTIFGANYTNVIGSTYQLSINLNNTNYSLKNSCILLYRTAKVNDIYWTIEEALTKSENVTFAGNSTSTNTYIATSFTKLNYYGTSFLYEISNRKILIPFEDSLDENNIEVGNTISGNTYSALIIPSGITLTLKSNSSLVTGARIAYKQSVTATYSGNRGVLLNNGNIICGTGTSTDKSSIKSYGYIKGDGLITINKYSKGLENMSIYDFSGGSAAMSISSKVMPMNSWSMHNNACKTKIMSGAEYYGFVLIKIKLLSENVYTAEFECIGDNQNDNCIFIPIDIKDDIYVEKSAELAQTWLEKTVSFSLDSEYEDIYGISAAALYEKEKYIILNTSKYGKLIFNVNSINQNLYESTINNKGTIEKLTFELNPTGNTVKFNFNDSEFTGTYSLDTSTNYETQLNSLSCITGSNQTKGQKDIFKLYGAYSDATFKISVSVVNMTTKKNQDMPCPLSYQHVIITENSSFNVKNADYLFLPGSSCVVEKGGSLTIGTDVHTTFASWDMINNYSSGFKTHCVDKKDAILEVNGTMNILGNVSGEITSTNKDAVLTINDSATLTTSANLFYSTSNPYYELITPSAAANIKDEATLTTGTSYVSEQKEGNLYVWGVANSIKYVKIVLYDSNGTTILDEITIQVVNSNTYPVVNSMFTAEKDYYKLDGWEYKDSNGSYVVFEADKIISLTALTESELNEATSPSLELKAIWDYKTYEFSYSSSYGYDENGNIIPLNIEDCDSFPENTTFTIETFGELRDSLLLLPDLPTYNSKNQNGWYIGYNKSSGKTFTSITFEEFEIILEMLGNTSVIPLYCEFTDDIYYNIIITDEINNTIDIGYTIKSGSSIEESGYSISIDTSKFDSDSLYEKYFEGFTVNDGEEIYTIDDIKYLEINDNITIKVKWSNKYKVNYIDNVNADSYEFVSPKVGYVTLPNRMDKLETDESLNGHNTSSIFKGWTINNDNIDIITGNIDISQDVSFVAYYEVTYIYILNITISNATITIDDKEAVSNDTSYSYSVTSIGELVVISYSTTYTNESGTLTINDSSAADTGTYEMSGHTKIVVTGDDESCIIEGTLITMADGTQKKVEEINIGDLLVVFNHDTGKFDSSPLLFMNHKNDSYRNFKILNLIFSDGTILKIVQDHGIFDLDLNKYVYINYENYNEYIGHNFYSATHIDNNFVSKEISLINAYITEEFTKVYCPVTAYHMNSFTNNLLSMPTIPYGIDGLVNIFEYDQNMKYDEELKQQDIDKYGLFTYDDFKEYFSYEAYISSPAVYLKVSIGKGLITYEEIILVIEYLLQGQLIE